MNNMFNDDITKSIASTVKDVLEGKPAVIKEEVKYPHMMYNPKDGTSVKIMNKADHDKYTKMGWGHDKPKNEVAQPEPKGEKEFKAKHVVKKSGEKEDGTVVKESTITIDEAKIDVDYIGDNDLSKKLEKKFKVKIKSTGNTTADVSGSNANLIKFLKSDAYLMDNDEIEELFPELMEEVEPEEDEAKLKESEKQAAYQKVFKAGLKKFGASGIGDMDDAKKKEFFNWVDKNYKSKAEEIDSKGKDEEDVNEAMSQKDMEKRLKLIKKAVEKINRQNLRNAKADAMKMMKQSGMFDEDASDEEEVDELTDKQKKLPAGLQKAIKAKEKEEVKERVHYAFDTQKAARTFQNKVDGMPMNIVKAGTGKYYIVDLRPGTKQADQEKAAKIAVSIGLSESYLEEAFIRTPFSSDEMKNVGGDKAAKKMGIKVKVDKGKGDGMFGDDRGLFTGDEKALVKYFQDYMGFDGNNFRELKKEFHK